MSRGGISEHQAFVKAKVRICSLSGFCRRWGSTVYLFLFQRETLKKKRLERFGRWFVKRKRGLGWDFIMDGVESGGLDVCHSLTKMKTLHDWYFITCLFIQFLKPTFSNWNLPILKSIIWFSCHYRGERADKCGWRVRRKRHRFVSEPFGNHLI